MLRQTKQRHLNTGHEEENMQQHMEHREKEEDIEPIWTQGHRGENMQQHRQGGIFLGK